MTANKDQKQRIRARMEKTGESYTAARAVLLKQQHSLPSAAPKSQWPKLAGVADKTIKEKTGKRWVEWVAFLDAAQAHTLPHRDIANNIRAENSVSSGWWAQSITVGYERIRGLRDVGQQRSGDYAVSKSRTFNTDITTLFKMFKDTRRRKTWLPEAKRIRTSSENKSIRFDWTDDTQVNVYFIEKGANKATAQIEHRKLKTKSAQPEQKAYWQDRFDQLKAILR